MKTAKQYLLETYLPTTSQEERELWFQTNQFAQDAVKVMEIYACGVIDAIADHPSKYMCAANGDAAVVVWNSSVEDLKKSLKS